MSLLRWLRERGKPQLAPDKAPHASTDRPMLKVVVLGSKESGKSTAIQSLLTDPAELAKIGVAVRWHPTVALGPYDREQGYPDGTLGVQRLASDVHSPQQEWSMQWCDTEGGRLLAESEPESLTPAELPELYRASFECDLLLLFLHPDDLAAERQQALFRHFLSHVDRARRSRPRLMVAIVYSKVDEYGLRAPPPPRVLRLRKHFKALRALGASGVEAEADFVDTVEPAGDDDPDAVARRAVLAKSVGLWRQLAALLGAPGAHLNGYWVAARQPAALLPGWRQRALGEVFADFVRHRRHVDGPPHIGWMPLALGALAVALLLGAGMHVYARGDELARLQDGDLTARVDEPRDTPLAHDLLAAYGAQRELERELSAAIADPTASVTPRDGGARNQRDVAAARARLVALTQATRRCSEAVAALLAVRRELDAREAVPGAVAEQWMHLAQALHTMSTLLAQRGALIPTGALFVKLEAACRAVVRNKCDDLCARRGRELEQLLRRDLLALESREWLPRNPYALEDLCRLGAYVPCDDVDDPLALREVRFITPRGLGEAKVYIELDHVGGTTRIQLVEGQIELRTKSSGSSTFASAAAVEPGGDRHLPARATRVLVKLDAADGDVQPRQFDLRYAHAGPTESERALYLPAVIDAVAGFDPAQSDPALAFVDLDSALSQPAGDSEREVIRGAFACLLTRGSLAPEVK